MRDLAELSTPVFSILLGGIFFKSYATFPNTVQKCCTFYIFDPNLQFHNRNQRLICKYVDADRTMDDMEAAGRRILAASFAGGLRYMREKCANAYALRMKHGIPDVFVTFTCNPEASAIAACTI